MEIQCVTQLGTVECMRVNGVVRCDVGRCTSSKELQYELAWCHALNWFSAVNMDKDS